MGISTAPGAMTGDEIVELTKRHTIFEWSAQAKVDPIPVAGAKGCWFWTPEGKRYLDFNSQLMCTNIGHGDERVVKAIAEQAATLAYANPFMATEPRARLGAKLAEITPGRHRHVLLHERRRRGERERDQGRADVQRPPQDRRPLPRLPRRHRRGHHADRRSAALGRRARHPGRHPDPGFPPLGTEGPGSGRRGPAGHRGRPHVRGPEDRRRDHRGDRRRHERDPHPARRLHAGPARDLRPPRHPARRRRGHGRLRAHREVVRDRPLGRGARPDHDGQGPHQRLRPARRARHAPRHRGPLPRQRVLRRPDLQQAPPGVRHGACRDRRDRGGRAHRAGGAARAFCCASSWTR